MFYCLATQETDMPFRSTPGFFLSGQPMPPPGPGRLRPFGCVAVVSFSPGGASLTYVPDAEQERIDARLAAGLGWATVSGDR
jgi:hypothetical protein